MKERPTETPARLAPSWQPSVAARPRRPATLRPAVPVSA